MYITRNAIQTVPKALKPVTVVTVSAVVVVQKSAINASYIAPKNAGINDARPLPISVKIVSILNSLFHPLPRYRDFLYRRKQARPCFALITA